MILTMSNRISLLIEDAGLSSPLPEKVLAGHHRHDEVQHGQCVNGRAWHNHTAGHNHPGGVGGPLKWLFPLEQKIKNIEGLNTLGKQFLLLVSNLTPAVFALDILKPFNVTPYVASPLAISAMHITNRGKDQLHKLLFTVLSSEGIIALQKLVNLPRILIRPIMALAVYFIERDRKNLISKNSIYQDLAKLLKLQAQINTIPWLAGELTHKLKEMNESAQNVITRGLSNIGISAFHIVSLSLGFMGLGHLVDKLSHSLKLSSEDSLTTKTEAVVCSCCGSPVCIAEAASEVGSVSALG